MTIQIVDHEIKLDAREQWHGRGFVFEAQNRNGHAKVSLFLAHGAGLASSTEAREIAAALLTTADRADELTGGAR